MFCVLEKSDKSVEIEPIVIERLAGRLVFISSIYTYATYRYMLTHSVCSHAHKIFRFITRFVCALTPSRCRKRPVHKLTNSNDATLIRH